MSGVFLKNIKVAFISPMIGTTDNLLYMQPLLSSLYLNCKNFKVFMTTKIANNIGIDFDIDCSGQMFIIRRYNKNIHREGYTDEIRIISPWIIKNLWKYSPDLIILNDFNLLSFFIVISRQIFSKARMLLLVETKPPKRSHNTCLSVVRHLMRTLVARKVDAFLTNNNEGKKYLTEKLGAKEEKVIAMPYLTSDMAHLSGLKNEKIKEVRSSRAPRRSVKFLYVGQLIPRKGLQYSLSALAALLPQYAGKFTFDIVGDGSFREQLQSQVRQLGLSSFCLFHGRQPYSFLWQWYMGADVFLYPTLSDYRALAPFEALSMGLPIVGSIHDGGVNEVVDSGRNGFSCDPRDTEQLANILARFIEYPTLIQEFSNRSLEMASAYTLERAVESFIYGCKRALDAKV